MSAPDISPWLRARWLVEYALVRIGLWLIDRVPYPVAARLAIVVADAVYGLAWGRRAIACDNILRSGVATDPRAASRIARDSFRHFALMVVESLQSHLVLSEDAWRTHVRMEMSPDVEALLRDSGRGLILASGHYGNWEIAAQLVSTLKPVAGVTRPMSNPYVEKLVKQRKPRMQFRTIPKHDADMTRFLSSLRQGDILALMIDQHAGVRGTMVDFFGVPASTHSAIALLHLITGAPLCFGYCRRIGPMRFVLGASGPFHFPRTGDKQRDIQTVLRRLNEELEKIIREAPEQYMWGHRRWKGEQYGRSPT